MQINLQKRNTILTFTSTNETNTMTTIQLAGTKDFINKLTANKLNEIQLNRASAYLRAKGISFYDSWSKEHCLILDDLNDNKSTIIDALKQTL